TEKYIDSVGLADFASSKPYELSGGMRQRAALARVLVNEPEIILMDEPFGALDALTRVHMQELVRNIRKEVGSTMFMITHDVDEALTLANRIIVLSNRPGTIVRSIETDFCDRIKNAADDDIKYSEEYRLLRAEILDIINAD
ncbi:MAG: ABC transporter ATP-binding protein, partial [Clostridia bacterium]|nr:ABC transporter ATP-binding protein [Clostridia bacterium]